MRLYRAKDYNDMSRKAAHIISAQVIMKPIEQVISIAGQRSNRIRLEKVGKWTDISGATSDTLTVSGADIVNIQSYRCTMAYGGMPRKNL